MGDTRLKLVDRDDDGIDRAFRADVLGTAGQKAIPALAV